MINKIFANCRLKTANLLFLLLLFFIFHFSFLIDANATIRYVSHSGSSTPPYTTWETAADSIQKCINISSFGDTIYVANGIYKEQVIMIPGLALIGAGTDSCIIDTRELIISVSMVAVEVADSCLLTGFQIFVYYNSSMGRGIQACEGNTRSWIFNNKVTSGGIGFIVNNLDTSNHSNISISDNSFNNISIGIELFNSNAIIKRNIINIDPNTQSTLGALHIGAFFYNFNPLLDSNYIISFRRGINKSFGSRATITNNTIVTKIAQEGIFLSISDSANVYNNLVISEIRWESINNTGVQYLQLNNNYITGNVGTGMSVGPDNIVKNNVVTNAEIGIGKWFNQPPPLLQYNNVWNTNVNYSGFTPDTTNLSVDPMIINDDTTQGELDFHLQKYSPLIDAGDPTMIDKDSSRIDIGLYGGLYGEVYKYSDLAPRSPGNITAILDSEMIIIKWNVNTEADLKHYKLFRDTTANFIADSTTLVITLADTFYSHPIPQGADSYYYKVTAVDNQGNESEPSEEITVKITSVPGDAVVIINNYQLYQNYPNPFNPSTTISYKLKERGYVKLYVYDVKGELVSVLVNKNQEAGYYKIEFSFSGIRRQESGIKEFASGVYIYQIMVRNETQIPVFSDIRKMIYLK